MTPMQQLFLGQGGKKSTYLDDVFSTYLYTGADSSYRNINNGIDLAGEGGMVWVRPRNNTIGINVFDTARGAAKRLHTDATSAESLDTSRLDQFNSNGFRVNGNYSTNGPSSYDYTSWSFRKSPMFDVVTYTGNGTTGQNISHNLGSVPGLIFVKKTSGTGNWFTYHKSKGKDYAATLDGTQAFYSTASWDNTAPTSTHFRVKHSDTNDNNSSYVAYLFAGGASTAATARSVDFSGSSHSTPFDLLQTTSDSSDFAFGTGDFTVECWAKLHADDTYGIFQISAGGLGSSNPQANAVAMAYVGGTGFRIYAGQNNDTSSKISPNQWFHIAYVRQSSVVKVFINGTEIFSITNSYNYSSNMKCAIGNYFSTTQSPFRGQISNFRVVKGTAVYTSSFRPPTAPLTNITNTVLLCCNNSSVTGKTVGAAITASGSPTASTDSPFDDPAAFVFGDAEDQNVIKCGSYKGASSHSTRLEVNLGFEPQWVLIKNADSSKDWVILDSMRRWEGDADNVSVSYLVPNSNGAESDGQMSGITPTGFVCQSSSFVNGGSDNFVYVAIRRPDPLVQKPQSATDVFAMDRGDGNPSALPSMDSNFPVDFGTIKLFASNQGWYTGSRLTGSNVVFTDNTNAASNNSILKWDSNEGFWKNLQSTYQGWMWKRHAGFDCLFYKGDAVTGRVIRHNLSKPPEMIWIKKLDQVEAWAVGHKDLDGGNEPWTHYLQLESSAAEQDYPLFNDQAPTSYQFAIHQNDMVNGNSHKYIAMLFASVSGISSVGSYSGNNSSSGPTVTTGFSPRFILIKRSTGVDNWFVFDTLRGISNSGNDARLKLDESGGQTTNGEWLSISSTGFTLKTSDGGVNANSSYIYYAHA